MLRFDARTLLRNRISSRQLVVLLICAAAAAAATFALIRVTSSASGDVRAKSSTRGELSFRSKSPTPPRVHPSGPQGPDVTPTLARPIADTLATRVSMSDAASALGRTLLLPNTPQVAPADAGAVWMEQAHGDSQDDTSAIVAVTFPSQRLIILYMRPPIHDPLAYIQASVKDAPGSQLVWLGSVPAWLILEPSDGSNWSAIEFVAGGVTVDVFGVFGRTSGAALQAIAQSIVDQAAGG